VLQNMFSRNEESRYLIGGIHDDKDSGHGLRRVIN